MKLNADLKKIWQFLFELRREGWFKLERDPYRDWKIAVLFFIAVFVFMAVGSYFLFQKMGGEAVFDLNAGKPIKVETLSREDLDAVIEYYSGKGAKYSEAKKTSPKLLDPSL